jgi:hypothetical protein
MGWDSDTAYGGDSIGCAVDCVVQPLGGTMSVTPGRNGSLRVLVYSGSTVVEVLGNLSGVVTEAPRAITYDTPVEFATYALWNNDSLVDRLVQLQPSDGPVDENYEYFQSPISPAASRSGGGSILRAMPRVEVCIGNSDGSCTKQPELPIARAAATASGIGFEYRQAAKLVGVADVIGTSDRLDGIREIVVTSSGAGLANGSIQSRYNLVETSVMTLGGDPAIFGTTTYDLPRSVSVIGSGEPMPEPLAGLMGTFWQDGSTGRGPDVATVYASGDVVFARNRSSVPTKSTPIDGTKVCRDC